MLGILTSFVRQGAISLGVSLLLAATAFAVARPPHKSPPFQPAAIERRPATAAAFIGAIRSLSTAVLRPIKWSLISIFGRWRVGIRM